MKSLRFFKGLSWLLILNSFIKPVWIFAIDRRVQNAVGYQEYGRYFSILGLSIVLSFIADAGLTSMVNRQYALADHQSYPVKQLLLLKFFFLVLYGVIVWLAAVVFGVKRWDILAPVIYIQTVSSLFIFFRNIITAHQLFTTDAWLSIIDKTLMIIVCGAFITTPMLFGFISLPIFLQAQMICTTIAVCLAAALIYFKKLLPGSTSTGAVRKLFSSLTPFAAIILLMSAHNRSDGFLLERMHYHGAYEAGVYASAFRLLDAGNTAGYLAASFLVPFVAHNKNNASLIYTTVIKLRHALLFLGLAAAAFTIALAPFIEQALYHTALSYNILVLQLCIAALPAYYLQHIYGSVLTAMGQFSVFIRILVICLIMNMMINVLFIPSYGALACCIAAVISQYSCSFMVMMVASRYNNIALHIKSFFLYAFAAAGIFLLFFFINSHL